MRNYSDTTVKIEAAVVREASSVLEAGQTLTSYVREVVSRDIKRRKLKQAARSYQEVLEKNSEEQREAGEWGQADLASPPTARKLSLR